MTDHARIADDLAYVRGVAEQGRRAPLLAGPHFLIWGGLGVVALVTHWAALTKALAFLAPERIGLIWIAFAALGTAGSVLAARRAGARPGARSIGNRVSGAVWTSMAFVVLTFALATGLAAYAEPARDVAYVIARFDTILAVAFGGYGVAFYTTGRIADVRWMSYAAAASVLAMATCLFLLGRPALYLFAAAFVLAVVVVPGFLLARGEPAALTDAVDG